MSSHPIPEIDRAIKETAFKLRLLRAACREFKAAFLEFCRQPVPPSASTVLSDEQKTLVEKLRSMSPDEWERRLSQLMMGPSFRAAMAPHPFRKLTPLKLTVRPRNPTINDPPASN